MKAKPELGKVITVTRAGSVIPQPIAQTDGHDAPGLIDEPVPSRAAMVDEIVVGFEDVVLPVPACSRTAPESA